MARYETTLELQDAYMLDDKVLTDIFQRATAFVRSAVSISLNFGDVHTLNSDSLSEVLNDSLLSTDTVTEVVISGSNYENPARSSRFSISSATFRPTCRLSLEGEQDACRALSSHIEALLRAKRQWYSFMIIKESLLSMTWLFAIAVVVLVMPVLIVRLMRPSLVAPVIAGE